MASPATQPLEIELDRSKELRIRWADGHDAGIYDYALLRSMCPAEKGSESRDDVRQE